MSKKSTACYDHALSYFDKKIFGLNCMSFTTDYEKAMRNALKKLFPDASFVNCYFHYTQAVKKKAWSTEAMHRLLSTNEDILFIYHRMQCLPLLPAEHIPACFNELQDEAFADEKFRKILKPFFTYYHNQWIVKVTCFFFTKTSNHFHKNLISKSKTLFRMISFIRKHLLESPLAACQCGPPRC